MEVMKGHAGFCRWNYRPSGFFISVPRAVRLGPSWSSSSPTCDDFISARFEERGEAGEVSGLDWRSHGIDSTLCFLLGFQLLQFWDFILCSVPQIHVPCELKFVHNVLRVSPSNRSSFLMSRETAYLMASVAIAASPVKGFVVGGANVQARDRYPVVVV